MDLAENTKLLIKLVDETRELVYKRIRESAKRIKETDERYSRKRKLTEEQRANTGGQVVTLVMVDRRRR